MGVIVVCNQFAGANASTCTSTCIVHAPIHTYRHGVTFLVYSSSYNWQWQAAHSTTGYYIIYGIYPSTVLQYSPSFERPPQKGLSKGGFALGTKAFGVMQVLITYQIRQSSGKPLLRDHFEVIFCGLLYCNHCTLGYVSYSIVPMYHPSKKVLIRS